MELSPFSYSYIWQINGLIHTVAIRKLDLHLVPSRSIHAFTRKTITKASKYVNYVIKFVDAANPVHILSLSGRVNLYVSHTQICIGFAASTNLITYIINIFGCFCDGFVGYKNGPCFRCFRKDVANVWHFCINLLEMPVN
jgi:hypothetical protein